MVATYENSKYNPQYRQCLVILHNRQNIRPKIFWNGRVSSLYLTTMFYLKLASIATEILQGQFHLCHNSYTTIYHAVHEYHGFYLCEVMMHS